MDIHAGPLIWKTPNIPPGQLLPPGGSPGPADTASEPGLSIADALQKQLGLRLVPTRAKLDALVIDKADKVPTEN